LQIPDSVPVPKTTESTSRIPFSSVPTVIPKKRWFRCVAPCDFHRRSTPERSAEFRQYTESVTVPTGIFKGMTSS
jgi:hypothetical protein